MDNFDTDNRL